MFLVCFFVPIKGFGLLKGSMCERCCCTSIILQSSSITSLFDASIWCNSQIKVCCHNQELKIIKEFSVLADVSPSLMPSPSVDGSPEPLLDFGLTIPVYQLNSFIKFWKPSSPKKSKEPGDEPWGVPRWMRSSTSRTTKSSGISRFQPAARMLYHLALSEHSWASCRFPWVFWSLACTDAIKYNCWWNTWQPVGYSLSKH